MSDWSLPTIASNYQQVIDLLRARDEDTATQFSSSTATNIPVNAIKFDLSTGNWKKWDGKTWVDAVGTFNLPSVVAQSIRCIGGMSVDGDVTFTGNVTVSGGNVATKQYVDDAIAKGSGVSSFMGRKGDINLLNTDINSALGYLPPQPNGTGASGTWPVSISGVAANAAHADVASQADNATRAASAATADNGGVTAIYAGANIIVDKNKGDITISAPPLVASGAKSFTASGTFTVPEGCHSFTVLVQAGGAGGGGTGLSTRDGSAGGPGGVSSFIGNGINLTANGGAGGGSGGGGGGGGGGGSSSGGLICSIGGAGEKNGNGGSSYASGTCGGDGASGKGGRCGSGGDGGPGGGGGGGGWVQHVVNAATAGQSYAVTVGAGGKGGSTGYSGPGHKGGDGFVLIQW